MKSEAEIQQEYNSFLVQIEQANKKADEYLLRNELGAYKEWIAKTMDLSVAIGILQFVLGLEPDK